MSAIDKADFADAYVLAHPDEAMEVYEHDAIWVDGNAMVMRDSVDVPRGTFRIVQEFAVRDGSPSSGPARGWIDLDDLRRRIARFAEAAAKSVGIVGARADVKIDASDGGGSRRISVEVSGASSTPERGN